MTRSNFGEESNRGWHLLGFTLALTVAALEFPSPAIYCVGQPHRTAVSSAKPSTLASRRVPVATSTRRDRPTLATVRKAYGTTSLIFEANRGQSASQVTFLARGRNSCLFLTAVDSVLVITHRHESPADRGPSNPEENGESAIVRMKLAGSSLTPKVLGHDQLRGKASYFIGSDPNNWVSDIPTYSKVEYRNVYPGIDMVYHGDQRQLEYDLMVAAGADPRVVTFAFDGTQELEVDGEGNLVLQVAGKQILQRKPNIYQTVKGLRRPIEGKYVIKGTNQIGFEVGSYDRSKPLVIDPVLDYSTFLGGSDGDEGVGITVDSEKNTYITGTTSSLNFPTTTGAFQTAQGNNDVFVTKLNAAGTAVLYSTYIGGSGNDEGTSIKVDAAGNAYVTGTTDSSNFPTTAGAFQTLPGGGSDAFVAKLNPTGTALLYSTYLGGSNDDEAFGVATDPSGNAYVTGVTDSSNFPTTIGASQPVAGGGGDAFVARLNPTGTALDYSTYLGGNGVDSGFGIATDQAGNAYVTGTTYSPNFPATAGAYQNSYGGNGDAFVAKLNPAGPALSYSTYLGGSSIDGGFAITYGPGGVVYLTGITNSTNFPTSLGTLQSVRGGSSDAFVTKLDTSVLGPTSLVYSTYLGGSSVDWALGLTTDLAGNAYLSGATHSTNFPVSADSNQTTNRGGSDAFVVKLNSAGTALLYATYLGGGKNDAGMGNAADPSGSVYLTGITDSIDFPTSTGAFQTGNAGGSDAFVTKLDIPTVLLSAGPSSLVNESCLPFNNAIDPGERDTVNLTLLNTGTASTSNLVATLQQNPNVLAPSGPQNYGTIAPNGSVGRNFSFTADGSCGDVITLTLQLQDGTTNVGTTNYTFTMGCNTACAGAPRISTSTTFSCNGATTIANITISNSGTAPAFNVMLTTAKLGTVNGSPLPQSVGNLALGASTVRTVTLSGAPSGSTTFQIGGTYTGGTFNSNRRVTAPNCTVAVGTPAMTPYQRP